MLFAFDSILLGLEYGLLAIGVYITFRILNVPDLTVDGSFTFGLAVSAVLTVGGHPFLALPAAFAAGAAAGSVTGLLQTKAKIHPILAGILTMSALYTVNITVMGGAPNISLLTVPRFFEALGRLFPDLSADWQKMISALLLVGLAVLVLALFFKSVLGLCIRATGNNIDMVRASSINVDWMRIIALALANGMAALSGGILAQYQGYADISSGSGMIVIGLASVIIGEVFLGRRSVTLGLLAAVLGSVVYRLIIALALRSRFLSPNALNLVSAVIVGITLTVPVIQNAIRERAARRGNRDHA